MACVFHAISDKNTLKKSLGKLLRCLQIKGFGNILPYQAKSLYFLFSLSEIIFIRDPPLELSK